MKNLAFRQTKNLVLILIITLIGIFVLFSIYQRNLIKEKLDIVFNTSFPTINHIQNIETLNLKVQNVFNLYFNQKSLTHFDIQNRINLNGNLIKIMIKDEKTIEEFDKLNLMFNHYAEQYKIDITSDTIDNILEVLYEHIDMLIETIQSNDIKNRAFIVDNLKFIKKSIEEFTRYDINLLVSSIKQLENKLVGYKKLSSELNLLQSMVLDYDELNNSNSTKEQLTKLKRSIILKQNIITKMINNVNRQLKNELDTTYVKMQNSMNNFNTSILIMLILSIVILIFSSYLLNNKILEPINKLRQGIKLYLNGNKNNKITIENDQEFQYLANAINNMTKEINQSHDELYSLNNQLEDKVKERTLLLYEKTKELEDLNRDLDKRIKKETSKRLEQEKLLAQQARLAAMGEMIGNIAHQWRQPLNALGLLFQNIQMCYELDELDDEFMKNSMKKANNLTGRMSNTIDDFRNFFKPNKQLCDFKIKDEIENSLNLISANFESNYIIVKKEFLDDGKVIGFPNEFSQVILNILSNSKDVLINREIKSPIISIKIYKEQEFISLEIEDNAGGIEKDIITKIFDPYFTTKHQSQGTGIGLYMSKLIIENNMKGRLEVFNSKNGAVFKIIMEESTK